MKKRNLIVKTLIIAGAIFIIGCTGKYNQVDIGNKFFTRIIMKKSMIINEEI